MFGRFQHRTQNQHAREANIPCWETPLPGNHYSTEFTCAGTRTPGRSCGAKDIAKSQRNMRALFWATLTFPTSFWLDDTVSTTSEYNEHCKRQVTLGTTPVSFAATTSDCHRRSTIYLTRRHDTSSRRRPRSAADNDPSCYAIKT